MNAFDNVPIYANSFAYRDLLGNDRWEEGWTVSSNAGVVGTTSYAGRYRIGGASCQFQAKLEATTSVASVAGTTFIALPIAAKGISGIATMTNDTTNIAVGVCHIDVDTSRCYLPAQTATSSVLKIAGWFEIEGK